MEESVKTHWLGDSILFVVSGGMLLLLALILWYGAEFLYQAAVSPTRSQIQAQYYTYAKHGYGTAFLKKLQNHRASTLSAFYNLVSVQNDEIAANGQLLVIKNPKLMPWVPKGESAHLQSLSKLSLTLDVAQRAHLAQCVKAGQVMVTFFARWYGASSARTIQKCKFLLLLEKPDNSQ